MVQPILVATRNPGKLREYAHLLADLPVEWLTLDQAGITLEVEETGDSFLVNARLKATAYARASGLLSLADDSGLEVDALGGAPGVNSARYAGPGASDRERYELLLSKLKGVPRAQRLARFVCVVAIATPHGVIHTTRGEVRGRIIDQPRGEHGFGYDPVFWLEERGCTMAELPPDEKNQISHRARALRAMRTTLVSWLGLS
jgi:XTP/dITP diphosphohydrolase